jgi:hypothetical protein
MQVATKRAGPADSEGLPEVPALVLTFKQDIGARLARKLARSFPDRDSESDENLPCRLKHHRLKEVTKAAKKAKVFETQKVVKNLKTLRHVAHSGHLHPFRNLRRRHSAKNVEDIQAVEAQLEKLKVSPLLDDLNYGLTANAAN